ncbi:MAG: dynamin family protein [Roseobacter sp.]
MTDQPNDAEEVKLAPPAGPRRPRIALMGEFSAGKSTLANLMIGTDPLPVQVVATQLPPVWISHGTQPSVIVGLDGSETPCDLGALQNINPEDVAFIRFYCEEQILEYCDIIDMPGISDPNMSSAVWERIMPLADGVVWCSPSTQAWRQSEAAVWDGIDEKTQEHSILLLTRGDMLLTPRDKEKVLKRVNGEAGTLFESIRMVSLTAARDAGDDADLWEQSGVEPFVSDFLKIIQRLEGTIELDDPLAIVSLPLKDTLEDAQEETAAVQQTQVQPRKPVLRRPAVERPVEDASSPDELKSFMPKFS